MAGREQLIIRLRSDGTVQAETKHIYGDACVPFAALLEDLCDAEAIESNYTQDYHASAAHDGVQARNEERDNT